MHDVKADQVRADQIVPTKDERKLGARCLFANARWPWRGSGSGLPPAGRAGRSSIGV
jgi:hypothetical protein